MAKKRKTIVLDFDGVIHAYSKGWFDGSIYDPPLPGALRGIAKLMDLWNVCIVSTRDPQTIVTWFKNQWGNGEAMFAVQCIPPEERFWDKPYCLGITNRKIVADVYVDDRAYHFDDWKHTVMHLCGPAGAPLQNPD